MWSPLTWFAVATAASQPPLLVMVIKDQLSDVLLTERAVARASYRNCPLPVCVISLLYFLYFLDLALSWSSGCSVR
jgi:hypothetical protein